MDDKYLDNLITQACQQRKSSDTPSEEFYVAIARQGVIKRRKRIFARITAAASVCVAIVGAIWLFLPERNQAPALSVSPASSLYMESLNNATERIDQLHNVQAELRQTIESNYPF